MIQLKPFDRLSLTQYVGEVGDAVTENVIQLKDLIYIIGPIAMLVVNRKLKNRYIFGKIAKNIPVVFL